MPKKMSRIALTMVALLAILCLAGCGAEKPKESADKAVLGWAEMYAYGVSDNESATGMTKAQSDQVSEKVIGDMLKAFSMFPLSQQNVEAMTTEYITKLQAAMEIPPQPPEYFLDEALGRIRGVMARHGDAEKPIWITEIGWPTHTAALPEQNLLLAGLRVAQPERRVWRAGCVGVSDDTASAESVAAGLRIILPEGSTAQAYTPTGLVAALKADALDLVVYPFAEAFPLETLDAVRDFVAKGGTLVDFGGAPMWFAYSGGQSADRLADGRKPREAAWEALRISLVFPSKENGLSSPSTVRATPEGIAAGLHNDLNGFPCHRFFDAARLREGDEMVPLLAAAG
ncbi:MAG: hypothetical protein IJQ78_02275, partial [Selenomonadaceae bacterium]|nr:hypothetical protein [Selenomonadaceae bacterium]